MGLIGHLLGVAREARSLTEYEAAVFEALEPVIGFDVAVFSRQSIPGAEVRGLDRAWLEGLVRSGTFASIAAELAPMRSDALRAGGSIIDSEYFGPRALERTTYYQQMLRPNRGRSTLFAYLTHRGRLIGTLALGRTSARPFSQAVHSLSTPLVSALSVGELAVADLVPPPFNLTAREHELVEYLRLGYTNREIGCALGTSPLTVRNQLVRLYQKLGASTRSEAVALCMAPRAAADDGTYAPSSRRTHAG